MFKTRREGSETTCDYIGSSSEVASNRVASYNLSTPATLHRIRTGTALTNRPQIPHLSQGHAAPSCMPSCVPSRAHVYMYA